MVDTNRMYDQASTALAEPDAATREILLHQLDCDLDNLRTFVGNSTIDWLPTTDNIGATIIASLMPQALDIHEALLRRDARFALVDTALAVEQFRFDHGHIPRSLSELVPEYLAAVPLDPCSPEDELLYVVHPNDAYVLYSVSDNGVDDGGTSARDDVIFQVRMPVPEMPQFETSPSDEISAESEPATELQ